MQTLHVNDLIKNNIVLYYFLNKDKTGISKLLSSAMVFLLIPIILFILVYYHNTLFLKDEGFIGMLDDSLFLFAVFLVPIQLLILNLILRKYITFITEIPSFTKRISRSKLETFVTKYRVFISKKRPKLLILKLAVLSVFLFSNIRSLYFREGGWNSPEYLSEFILTILFLIVLFSVLIEILVKLTLIILAQIKLTSELSQNNYLDIRPLSLDNSGNLSNLSELSITFTYILIPFMISALAHYLTWSYLTMGFVGEIILISVSTVFLFYFPLGTVHTVMKKSKKQFLREIDDKYIVCCDKLIDKIDLEDDKINETKVYCDTLKQLYEKGKEMPVWPFDLKIMAKFFAILSGPFVIVFIEILLRIAIERLI